VIVHFLQLLSIVCGQSDRLSKSEKDQLDDFTVISTLLQFTIDQWDYDEDSELATASVVGLFAISSQFSTANEDPVVCGLHATPQAAVLGRHFIHVMNRGVKPKWLQVTALSTATKIFNYSQAQQGECFFFTNDTHVLIDIILREVINLEEHETQLRYGYLQLLQSAIQHHEYASKGSYKKTEVAEFLRRIAKIEFDQPAAELVRKILVESLADT